MGCSQGAQAKLAFDADSTFDASSNPMDFLYETVQKQQRVVGGNGITGTRSESVERARPGCYLVSGRIAMQPGPADYDHLLPRILGAAENSDVFNLAETLPSYSLLVDKVGSIFRFDGCKTNRAILRGTAGPGDEDQELLELILEVMGQTETAGATWVGTIPALGTAANRSPYTFYEGTFKVNTVSYEIKQFVLVVDNMLQPRWVNSVTPTEICPRGRKITLITDNPFTATEYAALYGNANAIAGIVGELKFTNGNMSATLAMPGLQWADQTPVVKGKQEIPLTLEFSVRKKSTTAELTWTNDSTA
jgi:hypothetical protein